MVDTLEIVVLVNLGQAVIRGREAKLGIIGASAGML